MKILITICARGGSKGIPGKNIKEINERPLIDYTITLANNFKKKYKDVEIALSTDSKEIITVAAQCGLETDYVRPTYLATDSTGKITAINDVLIHKESKLNIKFDYILDLDVTSPLRNLKDLENAFNLIKGNKEAINLFSVNNSSRNPYFNMVEKKDNGFYSLVKEIKDEKVLSRQKAPKVYDMNASFYFYKRKFFDLNYKAAVTDKSLIYIMPHECFDLDNPLDFEMLSYLILNNKLTFPL